MNTILPENNSEASKVIGNQSYFTTIENDQWQRPDDWLAMPEVSLTGSEKFVGLLAITNDDANFTAIQVAGSCTIDWGDGNIQNIGANTTAYHQYNYSSISSSTLSSRGYKQVIVTITKNNASFTSINLDVAHYSYNGWPYESRWLDIILHAPNITNFSINRYSVTTAWLERVQILSSSLNYSFLFAYCTQLQSVSFKSSQTITNTSYMFLNCSSLKTVPHFNTSNVTEMSHMFSGCSSLQSVPHFNTSNVTNMNGMFENCSSLKTVPHFNTSNATNMSNMFARCYSLETVPVFNLINCNDNAQMFYECHALKSFQFTNNQVALPNNDGFASNFPSLFGTFLDCSSLKSIKNLYVSSTNLDAGFSYCSSLKSISLSIPTTGASFLFDATFAGCDSLVSISNLDATLITSFYNTFYNCRSLSKVGITNIKASLSFWNCNLSKNEIESIFGNLSRSTSAPIITISFNTGTYLNKFNKTGTITAGSTTVIMTDTTGLSVGMEISGSGISDAVAVTFQDTGDTVTRTSHGLTNGTSISFASITTTTGISTYTPYYVVNATTNTFQISDTLGGSAKALTTNGSGTLLYGTTITAINPNVSITLSIPASSSGTTTTFSTTIKQSIARLKGWTVIN